MLTLKIDTSSDIPAAITLLQVAGAHHRIPLLRACRDGQIAHFEVARETPAGVIKQFFRLAERPTIVLVGDDDYASTGPAGWPTAAKLFGWARAVTVYASRGNPEHYQSAIRAAKKVRRVLLIETDTAHANAWRDAARLFGIQRILTLLPEGGIHPRPAAKS